jgi:hypothetical protein
MTRKYWSWVTSWTPMFVVTRLGGGNGRQPEQQTAATRSKMKASSKEWRIGRMCEKGRCEQLEPKMKNCRRHGSRTRKSLKLRWPQCDKSLGGLVAEPPRRSASYLSFIYQAKPNHRLRYLRWAKTNGRFFPEERFTPELESIGSLH